MKNKTKFILIIIAAIVAVILISGRVEQEKTEQPSAEIEQTDELKTAVETTTQFGQDYIHIAGYVKSGKDLLDDQGAKYDIVYTSNIDAETAKKLKERNPGMIILYQGPANYMFDSAIPIIEATTGKKITDEFWLKDKKGSRCGWGMTELGLPELWAIDIRKPENIEIIALFYANILKYQPHYEGVFFDVIEEKSRCDSISDADWIRRTVELLKVVREKLGDKIILTNSGWNYNTETPYLQYINGYSMESFLSGAAGFNEGLETVNLVLEKTREPHVLIYTVYSENTVTKQPVDIKNMRLALTLSLLNDNTYLSYDNKMEDVGVVLWQKEFSAELGKPLGKYYQKDNAYWREFENGIVVSSPYSDVAVVFEREYTDVTTGKTSNSFTIEKGDGRIFIKSG
jgi:hypothetical protein